MNYPAERQIHHSNLPDLPLYSFRLHLDRYASQCPLSQGFRIYDFHAEAQVDGPNFRRSRIHIRTRAGRIDRRLEVYRIHERSACGQQRQIDSHAWFLHQSRRLRIELYRNHPDSG